MSKNAEPATKRTQYIVVTVLAIFSLVIVGIGVALLFSGTKTPPTYTFSNNSMIISGQFGKTIDLSGATVEYLSNGVPDTPIRTNGAGLGKIQRGMFSLGSINVYKCILDKNAQDYIFITDKAGLQYYINCVTPKETINLYNDIISNIS